MSKVPLHEYEKVKARQKIINRVNKGLAWVMYGGLAAGVLLVVGTIIGVIWTAGYGIWVIVVAAVLALGIAYLWLVANDEEVLERARREGTIDE